MKTTSKAAQITPKENRTAARAATVTHPDAGLDPDKDSLVMLDEMHEITILAGGEPGWHAQLRIWAPFNQTTEDADTVSLELRRNSRGAPGVAAPPPAVVHWDPTIGELERFAQGLQYALARLRQRPLRAGVDGVKDYTCRRA